MDQIAEYGVIEALIGNAVFHLSAATVPAAAGAYVLLIRLDHGLDIDLPRRAGARLAPGHYLYCGSARGPGGLKARLARHMRKHKTIRWHIDRVTEPGAVLGAWVVEGGNECELTAALARLPMPIPGFGSSDCRVCASHLLAWPTDF